MKKTTARGFTLIELLVVIAIIGILSSVVLASLNSARQKSRDARRLSDVKQLQLALELYYDGNSQDYPDALSDLDPTYISVVPTDPQGAAYGYAPLITGDAACGTGVSCISYVIMATMEGAEPAGSFPTDVGGQDCDDTADKTYCVRP